jgi:hypothetical protein
MNVILNTKMTFPVLCRARYGHRYTIICGGGGECFCGRGRGRNLRTYYSSGDFECFEENCSGPI